MFLLSGYWRCTDKLLLSMKQGYVKGKEEWNVLRLPNDSVACFDKDFVNPVFR